MAHIVTETEMTWFSRHFRHSFHWKLPLWQLAVQPVMKFRQIDDISVFIVACFCVIYHISRLYSLLTCIQNISQWQKTAHTQRLSSLAQTFLTWFEVMAAVDCLIVQAWWLWDYQWGMGHGLRLAGITHEWYAGFNTDWENLRCNAFWPHVHVRPECIATEASPIYIQAWPMGISTVLQKCWFLPLGLCKLTVKESNTEVTFPGCKLFYKSRVCWNL